MPLRKCQRCGEGIPFDARNGIVHDISNCLQAVMMAVSMKEYGWDPTPEEIDDVREACSRIMNILDERLLTEEERERIQKKLS